ncbi:MAG: hypothetical protein AAFR81_14250 [Chloroflexota bacterium]
MMMVILSRPSVVLGYCPTAHSKPIRLAVNPLSLMPYGVAIMSVPSGCWKSTQKTV